MNLKIALSMETYGTYLGRFGAYTDVTAIATFPHCHSALAEHFVGLHIAQQRTVTLFMMLLNCGDSAELLCKLVETFLIGIAGKTVIHVGPLVILALCGMKQVDRSVLAYAA